MRGFLGKKSEIFKFEKIRKYEEKSFENKRFNPFKKHLYQNGEAESMPVKTDRLVIIIREKNFEFLEGKFDFSRIEIWKTKSNRISLRPRVSVNLGQIVDNIASFSKFIVTISMKNYQNVLAYNTIRK